MLAGNASSPMTSSREGTGQLLDAAPAGDDPRRAALPAELPTVSVILPFLNAEDTIEAQLVALREQTYDGKYEVIAADNGSSDASRRIVERCRAGWPGLRLVDAFEQGGVSHARNRGLAASGGDIVLGCDADDVVAADWIEVMVEALVRGGFDVVGGRFEEESLNPQPVQSWTPRRPATRLQASFGLAPVATGANFGAWAAVARSVEGWDTRYVGGGEDIVFSWRAQELGYRLGCAPDAIVHYRSRSTLATLARQHFRRGRQVPRLMRDFRGSTLGRPRFRRSPAKAALALLASLPRALVSSSARGRWVRTAATALGVVVGRLGAPR